MSSSTFTIIGLNKYLEYWEKDLFEEMDLPEGIDKEECINNILLMCGDNELLYPDGDFMIHAIGVWAKKWYRTFEKWVAVLAQEYNPLENTDRHEDWSDSESTSESNSTSSSESNSASASDSSSNSTSSTNDVSAFNVSSYSPQSAADGDSNAIATSTSNATGTSKTNALRDEYKESGHTGYIHGNIGTMTTQYLLREELETQRFNIYDEIAIIFMREFTLAL